MKPHAALLLACLLISTIAGARSPEYYPQPAVPGDDQSSCATDEHAEACLNSAEKAEEQQVAAASAEAGTVQQVEEGDGVDVDADCMSEEGCAVGAEIAPDFVDSPDSVCEVATMKAGDPVPEDACAVNLAP